MHRRQFLKTAGAGLAATTGAAFSTKAFADLPALKWRMASSFPKSLDTIYGAGEVLTKRRAEITDGKFEIRVFAGGEIVPALGVLDAVQQNTVECGHTASYYYHGKNKALSLDATIHLEEFLPVCQHGNVRVEFRFLLSLPGCGGHSHCLVKKGSDIDTFDRVCLIACIKQEVVYQCLYPSGALQHEGQGGFPEGQDRQSLREGKDLSCPDALGLRGLPDVRVQPYLSAAPGDDHDFDLSRGSAESQGLPRSQGLE